MKISRSHHGKSDRYELDFGPCSLKNGFAQVDTDQDAWYFGQWANPTRLVIVSYAEGDLCIMEAETASEFVDAIGKIKDFGGFKGIDPAGCKDIETAFSELGLAELVH